MPNLSLTQYEPGTYQYTPTMRSLLYFFLSLVLLRARTVSATDDPSYGHADSSSTSAVTTTTPITTATVPTASAPSTTFTGLGYQPTTPPSYESCHFDPVHGGLFELLTPNALAIVNRDGKAVEAADPDAAIPPFAFDHAALAPAGIYDLTISSATTDTLYFAVFKSGDVGFVNAR